MMMMGALFRALDDLRAGGAKVKSRLPNNCRNGHLLGSNCNKIDDGTRKGAQQEAPPTA
jgi:hypothetical protein